MTRYVALPDQPNINLYQLALLIGDAVIPDISGAKGLACLTGKRVLSTLLPNGVPMALTDDDRDFLRAILPALPPIWSCMPEDQLKNFQDSFRDHEGNLGWYPEIANSRAIEINRRDRSDVVTEHAKVLGKMIATGALHAFDSIHLPVGHWHANCFISHRDATAYLEKCGLIAHPDTFLAPIDSEATPVASAEVTLEKQFIPQAGSDDLPSSAAPIPETSAHIAPDTQTASSSEGGAIIGGRYFSSVELEDIRKEQLELGRKFVREKRKISEYQAKQIGPTSSGQRRIQTMAKIKSDAESPRVKKTVDPWAKQFEMLSPPGTHNSRQYGSTKKK